MAVNHDVFRLDVKMEDSDVYAVAISLCDATHVELLYGNLLLKEEIGCHIGVAETSRGEITVNNIFFPLEHCANRKHRMEIYILN